LTLNRPVTVFHRVFVLNRYENRRDYIVIFAVVFV
jgi:hypothetical protein